MRFPHCFLCALRVLCASSSFPFGGNAYSRPVVLRPSPETSSRGELCDPRDLGQRARFPVPRSLRATLVRDDDSRGDRLEQSTRLPSSTPTFRTFIRLCAGLRSCRRGTESPFESHVRQFGRRAAERERGDRHERPAHQPAVPDAHFQPRRRAPGAAGAVDGWGAAGRRGAPGPALGRRVPATFGDAGRAGGAAVRGGGRHDRPRGVDAGPRRLPRNAPGDQGGVPRRADGLRRRLPDLPRGRDPPHGAGRRRRRPRRGGAGAGGDFAGD